MREICVRSLGWEKPPEQGMATHSSILAYWNGYWILLFKKKTNCLGTFLAVQKLRLCLPMQGLRVWSLVRKPRSHALQAKSQNRKQKQYCNKCSKDSENGPHPKKKANYLNSSDFPGGSGVKNLPANAGETGSIPGSGRSPGEGNGNPLQHSCLGNPRDREDRRAAVHGVAELDTTEQLNNERTDLQSSVHFRGIAKWFT